MQTHVAFEPTICKTSRLNVPTIIFNSAALELLPDIGPHICENKMLLGAPGRTTIGTRTLLGAFSLSVSRSPSGLLESLTSLCSLECTGRFHEAGS